MGFNGNCTFLHKKIQVKNVVAIYFVCYHLRNKNNPPGCSARIKQYPDCSPKERN